MILVLVVVVVAIIGSIVLLQSGRLDSHARTATTRTAAAAARIIMVVVHINGRVHSRSLFWRVHGGLSVGL